MSIFRFLLHSLLNDDNLSNGSGWFFSEISVFYGDYELNVSLTPAPIVEEPRLPVFGTLDGETIEVGSDEIVFSGAGDDLIDSSAGGGGNRLYGQSGNDTFILGNGDRAFAGAGDDSFFLLGGDNVITGGAGSDSFWLAVAEIPESANTITDFELGIDVLGIGGLGIGFEDLTLTQNGADTSIGLGEDELAKLLGFNAGSLSADNFAFV